MQSMRSRGTHLDSWAFGIFRSFFALCLMHFEICALIFSILILTRRIFETTKNRKIEAGEKKKEKKEPKGEKKMGCAQSKSPEEEALTRNSREIDRFLKGDGRYLAAPVKVLLLGIGESGKSTVFKQCKLLQDETSGFSDVEVLSFLPAIHNNILSQMALLCYQARVDGQRLGCAEAEAFSEKILAGWREPLTPETASHVKTLWSDPVIRHLASQQSNSFHLNDSATYFFEQVDRVA